MPNWGEVLVEIQNEFNDKNPRAFEDVRQKYLNKISALTGRNVIAYYSGWLQHPNNSTTIINDKDKSAFMANVYKLDRSKGLDLILHTPGGDIAATESIVDYLYQMFGDNVRAIIPQISMSAGTMIALSCAGIIMGKQSNLGPIDPQMGGVACQAVLEEFEKAKEDVQKNPYSVPLWQSIISKYHPTFLGSCQKAIEWSESLVEEWLKRNMLSDRRGRIRSVLKEFSDHKTNKSHARHISKDKCKDLRLKIIDMEDDNDLQDAILSAHHSFMHTFHNTNALKIVENDLGASYIEVTK